MRRRRFKEKRKRAYWEAMRAFCAVFWGFGDEPLGSAEGPPGDTLGITQFSGFWQESPSGDERTVDDSFGFRSFLGFVHSRVILIEGKWSLVFC